MFLVIFLILEFVVFGAANPKFLRPQSIMNSIVNLHQRLHHFAVCHDGHDYRRH